MADRDLAPPPNGTAAGQDRSLAEKDDTADGVAAPARILVVEDDFLVACELEATLTEAGFCVVGIASTADQAIRLAHAQSPELAVVDVRLIGERDGVDAALTMFNELGIRSIFATAHHDPDTRERAARASPIAWLAKPYAPARLIPLIQDALSSLRRQRHRP
jgi:DNA-binding NtrC family response regulator